MAEYCSCTSHVPHWGTYFQNPQIYIINVPHCTSFFEVHIHPQYPILSVVPIVNIVVTPLFFICFMVNNYFYFIFMYTLQCVYRSLLTIPFPLISRKWVTNRSKMAGYTFCTPLVPQWGTYFHVPSILYNKSTPMYPTFWGTLGYTFSSYHISPACVF